MAPRCTLGDGVSSLLGLPDAMLREVVSWSPDGATANMLLDACCEMSRLRLDPTAAALLLMRCPCDDYMAALCSCGDTCEGGNAAIMKQLLQLALAGPQSDGPHTMPVALLHMVLLFATDAHNAAAVRALLARAQPPDVNRKDGAAIRTALLAGPPWGALVALLECGADPCIDRPRMGLFVHAAHSPDQPMALQLLLSHCSARDHPRAVDTALSAAVQHGNAPAARHVLPLVDAAVTDVPLVFRLAAIMGKLEVVNIFLAHRPLPASVTDNCLAYAASFGRLQCVALLLDHVIDIRFIGSKALMFAVQKTGRHHAHVRASKAQQRATVALLLERGAVVTPEVRAVAEGAGRAHWLPHLQQGAAPAVLAAATANAAAAAAAVAAVATGNDNSSRDGIPGDNTDDTDYHDDDDGDDNDDDDADAAAADDEHDNAAAAAALID